MHVEEKEFNLITKYTRIKIINNGFAYEFHPSTCKVHIYGITHKSESIVF